MQMIKKIVALVMALFVLVSCQTPSETTQKEAGTEADQMKQTVTLRRGLIGSNDGKGVISIGVVVADDKIITASIDEYQFTEDTNLKPVPNGDNKEGLAANFAPGQLLFSKLENDEVYSKMMADYAKATNKLSAGYQAIEQFVANKTVQEVAEIAEKAESGKPVDAISGSTLILTKDYLTAIAQVAKDTNHEVSATVNDVNNLQLKRGLSAASGKDAFTETFVLMNGDTIVLASLDEYQFFAGQAVANSDKEFGKGYADSQKPLSSKLANDAAYSQLMQEHAKATHTLAKNFQAIQDFVANKTVAEIEQVVATAEEGKAIDAISGSTLVHTKGYLTAIIDAAK